MDIQLLALLQVIGLALNELSDYEDFEEDEADVLRSVSLTLLYLKRTLAKKHSINEHEIDSIANAMQEASIEKWTVS